MGSAVFAVAAVVAAGVVMATSWGGWPAIESLGGCDVDGGGKVVGATGQKVFKRFQVVESLRPNRQAFRACGQELSSREPEEEREFRMRSITRKSQLGRWAPEGTADCGLRVREIGGW